VKAKIINFNNSGQFFDVEILEGESIERKTIALKDISFERYELENKIGINTIGTSDASVIPAAKIDLKNIIQSTPILSRKEKLEQVKNILSTAGDQNISADVLYAKLTESTLLSNDSIGVIADETETIINNFQYSVLFDIEIDSQKVSINDFREKMKKMDMQQNKLEIKHLLNQFIKLKWLQKEGEIFSAKFDNENWVNGGMRDKIKRLCHNVFSKNINGECDATKAIAYWSSNKNWLYNQTEMILQANKIDDNNAKNNKTFWQKGITMVKGWFGK
jgi:hypothetical protein